MSLKRIKVNRIPDTLVSLPGFHNEIRMRDEDGHPKAYIEYGNFILQFSRASLKRNHVISDVRILKK